MSKSRIIHDLHDDFGVTISEAEKAYDIAVEYIRLRSTIGDHPEDYEPSEYVLVKASAKPDVPDANVGDTISRQAALDALSTPHGILYPIRTVEELPSAEPRMKGKWIPKFDGKFKGGGYWFDCSECGRTVPEVRNGGWNFCPNCGARMER